MLWKKGNFDEIAGAKLDEKKIGETLAPKSGWLRKESQNK